MWTYNKVLEYPIKIKNRNPKLAGMIISQYGGPDGELGASLRYLSQRFGMPDQKSKAILNDIGTEELAHLEMVGTLVHQLTDGCSAEEMKNAVVSEAKRIGISTNALMAQILDEWKRKLDSSRK